MTAAPDSSPVETASPLREGRSYWASVWRQFRQRRSAMVGLGLVIALFLVAFYAPFLAEKRPIVWCQDGAISFPLFQEILAPSEPPERVLETGFNYLMIFIPFALLALRLTRANAVRRRWALGLLALFVLLPFVFSRPVLDATSYRELATQEKGWGIFPLIPYGPFEQGFGQRIAPTWHSDLRPVEKQGTTHLLGTDQVGRDVLVRLIHGSRVSLAVGIVSMVIAAAIGIVIGAMAGFFGGWVDMLLSRLIELMICFPTLFLILAVIAIMDERSILNIVLIIGCTGWTGIARLVRGEVLKQRNLDYVTAAIALGARSSRVIFRHVLPNAIAPVLVAVTFGIAGSILMESGLSFLGLGVDIPTASWGELLNQAREAPTVFWWLAVFPGFPIFFTVTIYNLVGEGLRDAMDPRLRLERD